MEKNDEYLKSMRVLFHSLTSRIHTIRNGIERILENIENQQIPKSVKLEIENDVDHIQKNLNRILQSKKLFTLGQENTVIDINTLLSKVIDELELKSGTTYIKTNFEKELPNLMANPQTLNNVFSLIILNSIDATENKKKGIIRITTKNRQIQKSIKITISDNGAGIKQEHIDKVFLPGFTTKPTGMGFGLSICKDAITKLNGSICIKNSKQQGVIVTVELPISKKNERAKSLKRESILLVDDEPHFLEQFGQTMRDLGYEVDTALDAQEACRKLQGGKFTLVLTDLRMPDEGGAYTSDGGLGVAKFVKDKNIPTSVAIMSYYHDDFESMKKAFHFGVVDSFSKMKISSKEFYDYIADLINSAWEKKKESVALIERNEQEIKDLWLRMRACQDRMEKGWILEGLISKIFRSISGFEIDEDSTNVRSSDEEIDLIFRNESLHPFWMKQGAYIAVECKNWHSKKIGKNEFVSFAEKIRNRSGMCRLGFLISALDFAKTIKTEMIRLSKESILVVPVRGEDLEVLVNSGDRDLYLRKLVDGALKY